MRKDSHLWNHIMHVQFTEKHVGISSIILDGFIIQQVGMGVGSDIIISCRLDSQTDIGVGIGIILDIFDAPTGGMGRKE